MLLAAERRVALVKTLAAQARCLLRAPLRSSSHLHGGMNDYEYQQKRLMELMELDKNTTGRFSP